MCDGQGHDLVRERWQSHQVMGAQRLGSQLYVLVQCPLCDSTLYAEAKADSLSAVMARLERSCTLLRQALEDVGKHERRGPTESAPA